MKYFFIGCLATVILLSGCATTNTLKAHQCQNADWQAIGYQDGIQGENAQKILHHTRVCQNQTPPNRALWEMGRQQGLNEYCTISNAYNLGRTGRTLNGVCEQNLEELHKANLMGLQQYETQERIHRFSYGYGFIEPWFIPYYPYWVW